MIARPSLSQRPFLVAGALLLMLGTVAACGDDASTLIEAEAESVGVAGTASVSTNGADAATPDSSSTDSAITDTGDTATTVMATTTTAPPAAATAVDVESDGPDFSYELVDILVGSVTATNAEVLFDADAVASEQNTLLVELDFQAELAVPNAFAAADFRLVQPDGRSINGSQFYVRDQPSGQINLAGRDSALATLAFSPDEPIDDLDGWSIGIERDGRVPTLVAFGAEASTDYPIELPATDPVTFVHREGDCVQSYTAATQSSAVRLDAGVQFRGIARAELNTRYVEVWVDITTVGDDQDCFPAQVGQLRLVELRLQIDGRKMSTGREGFADLEQNPVGVVRQLKLYPVVIPNDITLIELLAADDTVLASWDVVLPAVVGE